MNKIKDIYKAGDKVGAFTFIRTVESRHGKTHALFICFCGKEYTGQLCRVKSMRTQSCGCTQYQSIAISRSTHGLCRGGKRPEYMVWQDMWRRIRNPNAFGYDSYKELGVTICDEWKDPYVFFRDMGERPTPKHTLDRLNNNMGYCKENCGWRTRLQQTRNRRNTISITYKERTEFLADWAVILNIRYATLFYRLHTYKWSIEKAFTTPVNGKILNNAI